MPKNNDPLIFPLPNTDEKKANQHHTLFRTEDPGETQIVVPPHMRYTFYLTDFAEDSNGLHEVYNELRKAGPDDILEIRISSPGGYVYEGEILFNLIMEKFYGRTVTVLDPNGYSMGALTYCMGDWRLAYENSSIMFHNYSGGAWGKGHELLSQAKHSDAQIKNFFESVIVGLSEEEIERMYKGEDFWFNTVEMCKRDICTDVSVMGHIIPSKDYLKLLKKAKKAGKKAKLQKEITSLTEASRVYGIDVIAEWIEKMNAEQEKENQEAIARIQAFNESFEAQQEQCEQCEVEKPKKKKKKKDSDKTES